jgi:hypothetical protein
MGDLDEWKAQWLREREEDRAAAAEQQAANPAA